MRDCIKKHVEREAEVSLEVKRLRSETPEVIWNYELCFCGGYHITRKYPPGYVSEEAKKAKKLWFDSRK